jgi:phospholipase/carboxylesterase
MPGGRAWFHIAPDATGGFRLDLNGAREALTQLAEELPSAIEQAGCRIENTVVLGFSQGAMLGHALLLHERLPVRGLAGCSGRIVPEIFGSGEGLPDGVPVFLSHGTHDELIPVTSGHAIRAFYEENTPARVTWCEEPVGHGIGPVTLQRLRDWCDRLERPEGTPAP